MVSLAQKKYCLNLSAIKQMQKEEFILRWLKRNEFWLKQIKYSEDKNGNIVEDLRDVDFAVCGGDDMVVDNDEKVAGEDLVGNKDDGSVVGGTDLACDGVLVQDDGDALVRDDGDDLIDNDGADDVLVGNNGDDLVGDGDDLAGDVDYVCDDEMSDGGEVPVEIKKPVEDVVGIDELKGMVGLIDEILDAYSIPLEVEKRLSTLDETKTIKTTTSSRKRKLSMEDRLTRDAESHKVLPVSCKCNKGCKHSFTEDERKRINTKFWSLSYNDRKVFIVSSISKNDVKRRRTESIEKEKRRSGNIKYFLLVRGNEVSVCQKFFLETLGYSSNQVLKTATKDLGKVECIKDKRGCAPSKCRISEDIIESIITHIKSYDPQISHYRRVHAPNRLYLPSTYIIFKMHEHFITNSEYSVSYDIYRREVNKMNISFAKLGEEKCEECVIHSHHIVGCSDPNTCQDCLKYSKHITTANIARAAYKEEAINNNDGSKFSVDLQKVVMLPRMPGIKTVVFTKRIVAYNETFAPLGTKAQHSKKL